MDVTSKNFKEVLPLVDKALSECDFLAIDGEFTGITLHGAKIHGLDLPNERYEKLRKSVGEYLLMQFGMACFHYDDKKSKYVVKAFNFYVFPKPFSRQAPDTRFLCQSSSIDFLSTHNFDFNKLFREGISFLNPSQESKMKESLQLRHQIMEASSPAFTSPQSSASMEVNGTPRRIPIPEEHKQFIDGICEKIENFLNSDEKTLALDPCNGFMRKLIFQSAGTKFQSSVHLDSVTDEKKRRYILVTRVSGEEEFKAKENEKRQAEIDEVDDAVGFTKVIRKISESGKLVVGHNMVTDVLHVLHQFVVNPLPEEYEDFKAVTQSVFPRLADTKTMASTSPFRELLTSTALGDLQKLLENEPFAKPQTEMADGFGNYCTGTEQLHEAGYDAYITGLCFLGMSNYMGSWQDPVQKHVPVTSPLLQPFLNKLHLMRVYDIPYINLAGPDIIVSRSHVFHITFPSAWKTSDLLNLFAPFGNAQVVWLEESSAFVSLYQREQAPYVVKQLGKSETYRIRTYAEYQEEKKMVTTPSHGGVRKRINSDPEVAEAVARKRMKSGSTPPLDRIPTIPEEDEESAMTVDTVTAQPEDPTSQTTISNGESVGETLGYCNIFH